MNPQKPLPHSKLNKINNASETNRMRIFYLNPLLLLRSIVL